MENIKIEELKKAKALLDQKYFGYTNGGYGESQTLYEIMSNMDAEGAVDYAEEFFKNWEKYCGTKGIEYDGLSVSMIFSTFYSDEINPSRIEDEHIKPSLDDVVLLDVATGYYTKDGKEDSEDPIEYSTSDRLFTISFSEFKKLLTERGYELGVQSFDEIAENILSSKNAVVRMSHGYNNIDLSGLPEGININKDLKSFESDGVDPMSGVNSLSMDMEETHSQVRTR